MIVPPEIERRKPPPSPAAAVRVRANVAATLFLMLLGSYAYFWQSRDWNSASRLMLTYALVDRHRVEIDGLELQAGYGEWNPMTRRFEMVGGDLAQVGSHFYTDKAPGQSLMGAPVYAITKIAGELPDHPLNEPARPYWPSDYWVTLGTSGVMTAALGVLLYAFSLRLGASHLGGALVGLTYGLATPAFLYGTLFYGHQAAAFCTFTSFFLLYRAAHEKRSNIWNLMLAGLLAGFAIVVEYQTVGIVALVGLYAIGSTRRFGALATFALPAALSAALLLAYNYRAFGHPFELSYAHEVSAEFRAVHAAENPTGLRLPAWDAVREILLHLLWGEYRGLTFYAPITLLAPLGLVALLSRRFWGVVLVCVGSFIWMLAVNVTYPLWQGGWCTGPRFLLPALPFVTLAAAGLMAIPRTHWAGTMARGTSGLAIAVLLVAGSGLMLGCVAVGGRLPHTVARPVQELLVPVWRGELEPTDAFAGGRQFEWNVGRWLMTRFAPPDFMPPEPSPQQGLQFVPLVAFWLTLLPILLHQARKAGAVVKHR